MTSLGKLRSGAQRGAHEKECNETIATAVIMALASLFTLIDLFGPQAIVSVLTDAYGTTPGLAA
jgi:hypothetical protein